MRTRLLKRLREEANEYYQVLRCSHHDCRLTGVVFWGKPFDWYSPHEYGGELILASQHSCLPRVSPFKVVNSWWAKQITKKKRDYILDRINKLRSDPKIKKYNDDAWELVSILNEKAHV